MRPKQRWTARARSRLLACGVALAAALAGAVIVAGPASADVASSNYTIGSPTGAVSDVVASPGTVSEDSQTNFQVSYTAGPSLAGGSSQWVSVVPSESLASTPSDISLIGSSCAQAGTDGGAYSATGVTINLGNGCSLSAGSTAELDFTANAPVSIGTFMFTVTTSQNDTPASSNAVLDNLPVDLTAASYAFGANTTYSITEVPVAGLIGSGTSLTLAAAATVGTGKIVFVNSGAGGAGYTVTYTPPGGSATGDTVTNASATGATVTLTLATALADGEYVDVTASGQNPAASGSATADHVSVEPGNGTVDTSNGIDFGGSVSDVTVMPSIDVAGALNTYVVDFRATDAVAAGGYLYFSETAGPTNFSSVAGIEVTDNTQNWHFIATGASLSSGVVTVPLQDAITGGDSITVRFTEVTNPLAAGEISDFTAATTGDPVPVDATPYSIVANGSPGVVVTVNPDTTAATATYTISNIHAAATLTGGTSTIQVAAPAGTVFPNIPSSFSVTDSTTASGSGTVGDPLSGGGTSVVTFTVPNTINSGDVITLTVGDVRNPSTASSTDSITLKGSVTGPPPTAVTTTTTTTTTATTTTTTTIVKPPPRRPSVRELSARVDVIKNAAHLKLRCANVGVCQGSVTLRDGKTVIAIGSYKVRAGKTLTLALHIRQPGTELLDGAKHHTIKVTATITVSGGKTVKENITLVG